MERAVFDPASLLVTPITLFAVQSLMDRKELGMDVGMDLHFTPRQPLPRKRRRFPESSEMTPVIKRAKGDPGEQGLQQPDHSDYAPSETHSKDTSGNSNDHSTINYEAPTVPRLVPISFFDFPPPPPIVLVLGRRRPTVPRRPTVSRKSTVSRRPTVSRKSTVSRRPTVSRKSTVSRRPTVLSPAAQHHTAPPSTPSQCRDPCTTSPNCHPHVDPSTVFYPPEFRSVYDQTTVYHNIALQSAESSSCMYTPPFSRSTVSPNNTVPSAIDYQPIGSTPCSFPDYDSSMQPQSPMFPLTLYPSTVAQTKSAVTVSHSLVHNPYAPYPTAPQHTVSPPTVIQSLASQSAVYPAHHGESPEYFELDDDEEEEPWATSANLLDDLEDTVPLPLAGSAADRETTQRVSALQCFAKGMESFDSAPLFPLLTQGCVETCQRLWYTVSPPTRDTVSGRDEVIKRTIRKGTDLKIDSLRCLAPGQWLSGKVIDEMLKIICDEFTVNPMKCHPLSTSVFERICEGKMTAREEEKLRKIYHSDSTHYLLLPMHERGDHWTLAVISTKNQWLVHYDSMERNTKPEWRERSMDRIIGDFLEKLDPHTESRWRKGLLSCPQQPNTADCGVFLILNAIHFAAGLNGYYKAEAADYWRYRAVSQLISGSFKRH